MIVDVPLRRKLDHFRHGLRADLEDAGVADGLGQADDGPIACRVDRRVDVEARRSGDDVRLRGAFGGAGDRHAFGGAMQLERQLRQAQRFFALGAVEAVGGGRHRVGSKAKRRAHRMRAGIRRIPPAWRRLWRMLWGSGTRWSVPKTDARAGAVPRQTKSPKIGGAGNAFRALTRGRATRFIRSCLDPGMVNAPFITNC